MKQMQEILLRHYLISCYIIHFCWHLLISSRRIDVMPIPRFSCTYYAYVGTIEMIH